MSRTGSSYPNGQPLPRTISRVMICAAAGMTTKNCKKSIESHPIVFAGAGSHASYFQRGEYQAEVNLPLPDWFSGLLRSWNKVWTETLGQPADQCLPYPVRGFCPRRWPLHWSWWTQNWSPVLMDESTPWVSQYRGLWGLFARDPISGENAPAGPMYNRDGSPRGSWYDPLGFAGLDKVPPPPQMQQMLAANCAQALSTAGGVGKTDSPKKPAELQEMGIRLKGMEGNPHLAKLYTALEKEINVLLGRSA